MSNKELNKSSDRTEGEQKTAEADSTGAENIITVEENIGAEEIVCEVPTTSQPGGSDTHGWKPDAVLLDNIVELGFSAVCAEKALFYTGNSSADAAVGWILDNPDSQSDLLPLHAEGIRPSSAASSIDSSDMYKMVFVVNGALKMGVGKIAAQVGHATLNLYRDMETRNIFAVAIRDWTLMGETKVILKGEDEQHLRRLYDSAIATKLPAYLVHDAGHTQVPSGSMTVLSMFGTNHQLDELTGNLKLL